MQARPATEQDRQGWDRYVDAHASGSPYHLWAWGQAVESAYGHRRHYWLVEQAGQIRGVLPLFAFRVPLRGTSWVSLPFCDVGGPLADDAEVEHQLTDTVLGQLRGGSVTLRCGTEPAGLNGHPQRRLAAEKVRMLLALPDGSEALMASFKSKLRSQVRKAEKNGLEFSFGGAAELPAFYRAFSENMRDLGSPVHSLRLYREIFEHYGDRARLGLVRHQGEIAAGGVTLALERRVCIPWASSLRRFNRLAPNMLLYWGLLADAADRGLEQFDFGRSTEGEGTYKFKAQWGAQPHPLAWCEVLPGASEAPAAEQPAGGPGAVRSLVERGWRKLPLPLANRLGPRVRRYISL